MRSVLLKNAAVFLASASMAGALNSAYSHGLAASQGRWLIIGAMALAFFGLFWANLESFAYEPSRAKRRAFVAASALMIWPFCVYFAAVVGGVAFAAVGEP